MRIFFKQCLAELECRTGLRQLHWLQQKEDGAKQTAILIDSMVIVSKEFSYIAQAEQQRIISAMMVRDQDYDALSSRVIWKWLNMHKEHFASVNNAAEEIPRVELTPEQQIEVDRLLGEYIKQLSGNDFKPNYKNLEREIRKIKNEDKVRVEGAKSVAQIESTGPEYYELRERIRKAAESRGYHKLDVGAFKSYSIEGKQVLATSEEDAKEIYIEVYL